jgi:Response regulator containing a CheY-like receiver domain and an HTH DNA-binding domain
MRDKNQNSAIKISIVDDHPVIFWGIKLAIKKCKSFSTEIVQQYCCGAELRQDLKNLDCDVLLVDLCLPDMKGYELIPEILAAHPNIKVGIYSSMLYGEDILTSFQNGALGYLLKSADSKEIISFIETLNRGERYLKGQVAEAFFNANGLHKPETESPITKRELEIIQLISEGLRNKEIAEKLSISERTVEFHKQNIYLKLEVNNNVELVKKAIHNRLLEIKVVFS